MRTEAEMGAVQYQAEECQGSPKGVASKEKTSEELPDTVKPWGHLAYSPVKLIAPVYSKCMIEKICII